MNASLLGCCQDPVNQLFVMKCYSEEGRRPTVGWGQRGVGGWGWFESSDEADEQSLQQLQWMKCCAPVLALIS